jgi:hypothetical protein
MKLPVCLSAYEQAYIFIYSISVFGYCTCLEVLMVLCICETCSLTLREKHRLRGLENRVLRRIFGLKRDNMVGGWRTLHIDELIRMIQSRSLR